MLSWNWKRFYFDLRTWCWFITALLLGGALLAIVYMSLVNAIAYILTGFACIGIGFILGMAFKVRLDPPLVFEDEFEDSANIQPIDVQNEFEGDLQPSVTLYNPPTNQELEAALLALTDRAIDAGDCRCRFCLAHHPNMAGELAYDPMIHKLSDDFRCLIPETRLLIRPIRIATTTPP